MIVNALVEQQYLCLAVVAEGTGCTWVHGTPASIAPFSAPLHRVPNLASVVIALPKGLEARTRKDQQHMTQFVAIKK